MLWRKSRPLAFDPDEVDHEVEDAEDAGDMEQSDDADDEFGGASGQRGLVKESNPDKCWQRALNLLARQDYTVTRLRRKLATEFTIPAVCEALERAATYGYVNDNAYAQRFIESRRDSKSRQEIRLGLRERGIVLESILFDEFYPDENEKEVILRWLQKRYRRALEKIEEVEELDEIEARKQGWQLRRRIYQALMRRGFGYESIDAAISEFMNPQDEE